MNNQFQTENEIQEQEIKIEREITEQIIELEKEIVSIGGTDNYNNLKNKPSINGKELIGDKTLEELGFTPYDDTKIKEELDNKQPKGDYALESDIPNISNLVSKEELPDFGKYITKTVSDLENYYNKVETNKLIDNIKNGIFKKVDSLPTIGETGIIYLILNKTHQEKNIYDEFIYIENNYEKIGTTEIDLSGYALKEEILSNYEELENLPSINGIQLIGNKSSTDLGINAESISELPSNINIANLASGFYVIKNTTSYNYSETLSSGSSANLASGFVSVGESSTRIAGTTVGLKQVLIFQKEKILWYRLKTNGTIDGKGEYPISNFLELNNTKRYTPINDYNPAHKKYVDDKLTTFSGYDNTKTQLLKNINGVITWVDEV